jgi:GT2 family glycosyltransferase
MRVSVIIVNLNGAPFIFDCLAGLMRQSFSDFETVLVDNGSTDGSQRKIIEKFPSVKVIELGSNKGFAFACEQGFRQSSGEEIAVLNNDAIPDPDWIKEMVSTLDSDSSLGMVACKVINQKSGKFESGGLFPGRNGLVYLSVPADQDLPQPVFGVCGVGGLYRGKMLRETGFYPEDFFIYYEDADLAYRAQRAGFSAVYCPTAVLRHLGSETTTGMGIKNYYLPRNRLRSVIRNWDLSIIIKNSPWLLFYEWASFAGGLIKSPWNAVRARIDFLRSLPVDLKIRKEIFARTKPGFELERWISKSYPGLFELRSARK